MPIIALVIYGLLLISGSAWAAPPSIPSVYTASTTGQFLASCRADRISCEAMVGEALMDKMHFAPTSHICLPGVDYADKVPAWLDTHREVSSMPVEDGIYVALTRLYRCGAPNNY